MTHRRYLLLVVTISLCGLWLRAPLLHTGFIVDDYAQLSMMAGTYPVPRSPLALFTFTHGDAAENQTLKDAGYFPWWTHPALKISLFRPLASALMWLDRAAFGDDAWLFHLHSALWWLCMSVTWGMLVRHFLPWNWALFVHALCTLHPANGMLIGWIANRNASVAMFFGLLALLLQVRRSEQGSRARSGPWLIAACWALALFSGEYATSLLVFSVTYELMSNRPAAAKWTLLKPCLVVLLAYACARIAFSFGSRESGMYVDPSSEPIAFLKAALARGPVLVADLVLGLRSNWWAGGYPWAPAVVTALKLGDDWIFDLRKLHPLHEAAGLVAIAIGAWLTWFGQQQNVKLRFAALALPLSFIPALGGTPESRLLLPAMFGWTLLLAQTIHSLILHLRRPTRGGVLALLVACALVTWETKASFDYSEGDTSFLPKVAHATRASILAKPLDVALSHVDDAFLFAAVDPTTTIYIPMLRRWHHHKGPARCHLLLSTAASMRLDRIGVDEFRVSRSHSFYTPPDIYAEAFRRDPVEAGQTFTTQTFQATVEAVQNGMPIVVRFKTGRNLDDPALVLLSQETSGLRVLRFPALGESVTVGPANFPLDLMGSDGPAD